MSTLAKYKKKRNFSSTAEPKGKVSKAGKELRFVIQRHAATRLHYDFRLEMEGVLKSWAVPKGPSLNPEDKRLAMMVEDHPYDYRTFEGTIPEGNYGAGEVEIWDEGTYEALQKDSRKKDETILLKELKDGSLKFILNGKKLKGEFALVKMKTEDVGNAWLLIKHKDEHAVKTKYDAEKFTKKHQKSQKLLRQNQQKSSFQKSFNKKKSSNPEIKTKRYAAYLSGEKKSKILFIRCWPAWVKNPLMIQIGSLK
ncbi:DNA polymerase ligase N-terminal domain-containing protein [Niabella ginsengisoli]|uniref:3'-phosphoesterase n=1 Tax=Niabella ginsengisoli TaxID=522298 RepID=A0ABS9SET2_9BACT|nr:DNA polymerase ligase N-terminal domain-containing protein [Niabella ginsengisoli]MCH5596845.1 3'-phosphoesterase [Niabella ginsengisoli]